MLIDLKPSWILICIIIVLIAGCKQNKLELFSYEPILAMDTLVSYQLYAKDQSTADRARLKSIEEIKRLEKIFSVHDADSEAFQINQTISQTSINDFPLSITVSDDLNDLLSFSLEFCKTSEGDFDITIKRLMELWGFGLEAEDQGVIMESRIPSASKIEAYSGLQLYQYVEKTESPNTYIIKDIRVQFDFGAVSKGYIIDQAIKKLIENEIESGFLEAGGDIYLMDKKPDGSKWGVGVENPRLYNHLRPITERMPQKTIAFIDPRLDFPDVNPGDQSIAQIFYLFNKSIVTSGDYERYFIEDQQFYHHIIDPQSGYPARECISVSVVADNAMLADALSTTLFVKGPNQALTFLENFPGAHTYMIYDNGDSYQALFSEGMQNFINP